METIKIIYNLVYNRKKCLNQRGTALVQIEAYLNRRKKYFSTHIYLSPNQWNARKRLVCNHPQATALNQLLREMVSHLEQHELELHRWGQPVSLEALKASVGRREPTSSFYTFYHREVMASSLRESTRRNHLSTLKRLRTFRPEVTFGELTFDFLTSFDLYLRESGCHTNTVAKHLKHLKRYINIAINKELIAPNHYPFRKFKIQTAEGSHTHLAPDELSLLERFARQGCPPHHRPVLDAFLFCCYAGLRYSDFISLTPDNFIEMRGEVWLLYRSVKTRTEVRLPLYLLFEGKALALLERYRQRLPDFFRLDDNSNVNKTLQRLAAQAGLSKRISFHTARHTNATLLIYSGVNITTVQKLLGHKSVKTTQLYTNIMDRTLENDLRKADFGICKEPL